MSTTTGKLPSSATRHEAVAKRKSPTSVAGFSPTSICAVFSPRRNSAPSKMSSCTSEAECKTSTLAASLATCLKDSASAPKARATNNTSAGLNRLPPVRKRRSTESRTNGLVAGSAKPGPSSMSLTSTNSRPMQRNEPSSAALGPSSGHAMGGKAPGTPCSPSARPVEMRACISLSAASSRVKPRPVVAGSPSPRSSPNSLS
mmetsp:Transcript_13801/g.28869  ORF Transcript_13801/g.28869 Transcript_13801/m.28869 type:complete len:202 (+) Transcript_13801:665-1270(+)